MTSEAPNPAHSRWAVDTSWLFALLNVEDAHHLRARKEAQDPGTLLVNPTALVETLDLVWGREGREGSLAAYRAILMLPQLQLMESPKGAAMARWIEKFGRLSWADASVLCTAQTEGAGLRSFDDRQRKAFAALA
jgi:predicted nucleic acid-binding protein